jgi:uncharacterized protein YdaU (DUF1376 family)
MNYYEHHLGDYARDASHLSMLREGAYRRLLDVYYGRERPLPPDPDDYHDLARCVSKAERDAVDYVLRKFFDLREDGWHQKRCDEEIIRFRAKSEAAKASANARWSHNGRNANASANGMRPHSEGNALQSPVSSLQSPGKNPTPTPPKGGGGLKRRSERRAEQDEAQAAWAALLASRGAKRDARIQAAIDAVGGWSRIEQREVGVDSAVVRKQFCDAYRSAAPA